MSVPHRARAALLVGAALLTVTLAACGTSTTPAGPAVAAEGSAQPSAPATITITHAQGDTEVPVNPETVLSFDFATTTTLTKLGVEVDGVPKANLPGALAQYGAEGMLDIGTLFEPNYEAVNAAAPDLIIVAGRSAAVLPELAKIAPTIDLSSNPDSFYESNLTNIRTLGQVFDKKTEAEALITDLDARVATLKAKTAEAGTALILLTNGGEVTAYGPGSRFGILHDTFGFTPAVADVEEATHGEAVSFEFVAEANPDWLFVVDREAAVASGGAAAAEVLDNELVAATTAAKSGQIVYVDAVTWYIINGGALAIDSILTEVETALG